MNTILEQKSRYPELMIQRPLSFEKKPLLSHCLIYQEEGQLVLIPFHVVP